MFKYPQGIAFIQEGLILSEHEKLLVQVLRTSGSVVYISIKETSIDSVLKHPKLLNCNAIANFAENNHIATVFEEKILVLPSISHLESELTEAQKDQIAIDQRDADNSAAAERVAQINKTAEQKVLVAQMQLKAKEAAQAAEDAAKALSAFTAELPEAQEAVKVVAKEDEVDLENIQPVVKEKAKEDKPSAPVVKKSKSKTKAKTKPEAKVETMNTLEKGSSDLPPIGNK